MKALSVKQPWANMIASGKKTIETRKWPTDYRGVLEDAADPAGRVCPGDSETGGLSANDEGG
jgi:hypothetical protein